MKKIIALLIAVVFVVGLAAVSIASPPVPESMKAKGKIVAVDEEASTITVKDKDGEVVIVIGADDLKKAKKGKRARVSYHEEDGKNVADKVKIKAARKAAQGC